jgi:hypothetical protein
MRRFAKYLTALAILGTVTVSAAPGDEKKNVSLSVAEMQDRATAIQAQLEADTQQILRLKELANKKKDVIKLNCVNDRLVELKAQRNLADQTNVRLQAAIQNNSDERHQIYAELNGIGGSVKGLREQATACIGEPELFKQESGVEVTHPDIIDDPTDVGPPPSYDGVEPPGYASAFQ